MIVDINSELLNVKAGDRSKSLTDPDSFFFFLLFCSFFSKNIFISISVVTVALASTLSLDGTPDDGAYNPYPGPSLMDSYDYVMHGR